MPRGRAPTPPPDDAESEPLRRLETENRTLTDRLGTAEVGISGLETQLAATRKELEAANKKIEKAADTVASNRELEQELAGIRKELTEARKLEGVHGETLTELEGLRDRVKATDQELTATKKELTASRGELEKTGKEVERLGAELAKARESQEKELTQVRAELKTATQRAQSDQVKSLAEREEVESELRASRDSAAALESALRDEKASREKEVAALRQAKESLKTEKAESKRLLAELLNRLEALETVEGQLAEERTRVTDAEGLNRKVDGLVELNRALQEELDGIRSEVDSHRRLSDEVASRIAEAVSSAEARAGTEQARLQKDLAARTAEIESLSDQLRADGKTPFLSPEQVSSLLNRFYVGVNSHLTGLDVRDSEIRLKVGFAGVSPEKGGLVVPTTENIAQLKEGLSEVVVRLGRKDL